MVSHPSWQEKPWQSENRWGHSDLPPFIPHSIDHDNDWRTSSTAESSYSSTAQPSAPSYSSWLPHSSSSIAVTSTSTKTYQHTTPWQTPTYSSSQWTPMPSMVADIRSTSTIPTQSAAPTEILAIKDGMDRDILVAAIVVPILAILTGIMLAFFLLRRRSLKNSRTTSALTNEKLDDSSIQESHPPSAFPLPRIAVAAPPIVTSQQNNAYNTGLDTWSSSSRSQSMREGEDYAPRFSGGSAWVEPPPPYSTPALLNMDVGEASRSPFEDPPSTRANASLRSRSSTSTLYAETSSVREAREAQRLSNPFASPGSEAPSPVSPVALDTETEGRRMSEISRLDHREEG
ncbi:hypothetical protein LTR37_001373 [Vermiconidia calcicola]|uniref:Uncharacterized protein n=1 Tax=Vermiconidia calcicola TaxID=1690605 RepID=A0ACC3NVQ1_9PEZI|nr:hypothetical protein LTR37_001373 [Vermiconidia calcicola]